MLIDYGDAVYWQCRDAVVVVVCRYTVAGAGLPVCPREARLSVAVTSRGGYLSNAVGPYRWTVGSELCPWLLTARTGQKIYLRAVVLHTETTSPVKTDEPLVCTAVYVIKVTGFLSPQSTIHNNV